MHELLIIDANQGTELLLQVKGVLDKEEVLRSKNNGWLFAAHVVVGTPECLAELAMEPNPYPITACLKALAVDEVDAYTKVALVTCLIKQCFPSTQHDRSALLLK